MYVGVGVGTFVGTHIGVGVGVGGVYTVMHTLFNNSCVVYHRYDATIFANFHH